METQEMSNMVINEKGVGEIKLTPDAKKAIQLLNKKHNTANNELGNLSQLEVDNDAELKSINKKIAELTEKFKARKKELRDSNNVIAQKRLILLGERMAYRKQIVDLGGKIKNADSKKLLGQIKQCPSFKK